MLKVFGMSGDRYDGLLPCRIPLSAAARKRSVGSSRWSAERTARSWASVRGWNATATSAGTSSVGAAPGPAPTRGTGTAAGSAATRSAMAIQSVEVTFQASRRAASRVAVSARVGGSTFAAVSRWANGLRSLPTPMRPSAQACSGVVPRPLNGSSTTSPRRLYRPTNACARAAGKLAR